MTNLSDIIHLLLVQEARDPALVPAEPKATYDRRRDAYIERRAQGIAAEIVKGSKA